MMPDDDNKKMIFKYLADHEPCGVDPCCVLKHMVKDNIKLPENPEVFLPYVDGDCLPTDVPEFEVIVDM